MSDYSLAQVVAVIPCLDEERFVGDVVARARRHVDHVIVVDDGSTDGTTRVASEAGAEVVRHERARGAGAATRTGFGAALRHNPDAVVTLDGDGQHDPDEIPVLLAPLLRGEADLVIGSRFLPSTQQAQQTQSTRVAPATQATQRTQETLETQPTEATPSTQTAQETHEAQATERTPATETTPETEQGQSPQQAAATEQTLRTQQAQVTRPRPYRRFGIWVITWLLNVGSRVKISDSQSCFRAHSRRLVEALDIREDGFGFSIEVLVQARKQGFRVQEVPISCIYHSQGSTLNPFHHGLSVALAAIRLRFRSASR
jgi:hypothetical protein